MADGDDSLGRNGSPAPRPATAQRVSPETAGANTTMDDSQVDAPSEVSGQQTRETEDSTTGGDGDTFDSSSFEVAPIDATRGPDETLSEEAMREHLRDVESSFMPALSPIATGATNADGGGVDDTYIFDSPDKAAVQRQPTIPEEPDSTNNTSTFEHFDSSPTAAAAARTISRALSMASSAHRDDDTTNHEQEDETGHSSQVSGTLSRSHSLSERMDAGATPGDSLRVTKRPKYLRSRHTSQRSSTSSFGTSAESHDGSEATLGMGVDYALQSGGAVPALGMPMRHPSNFLSRSISMVSVASGFDDYTDPSVGQLAPLPEIDSPTRTTTHDDVTKTPRASKENLNTVPTDTVIARHVRNVQVPESLAKEYKFKSGLETPRRPSTFTSNFTGSTTTTRAAGGKTLTLKEQSSTIERLSKENFDLKLKVMFLSDRLDKLSEEGIKEMISENVDLKTGLAVIQRDNKVLRKRVKELERQLRDEQDRPSTAQSPTPSADGTAKMDDENTQEREEELYFLRERVEEYATEIERLRSESFDRESEKRKLADIVRTLGERTGESLGRQEEADVWKDLLEQETARREQADDDNRRLRDEVFRLKQDMSGGQGLHHTTNIYNITKKHRDQNGHLTRPTTGLSAETENASNANFSAGSTLVDEMRKETEQLRHENAELRREVSAQTSMLTSRNREKERLYGEIEDLKMAQRHGRPPGSTIDTLLDRSASRIGARDRPQSRGSIHTLRTTVEDEAEREELENKLAEARDKNSEIKLQNQELQRELELCMEDFEAAVNGKREADEKIVQQQDEIENAMNDLVALQSERDEALREQSDMENEFDSLRREAQEEIDALESEADQRNEDMQQLQAELRDRSENFDALQEEMRKMSEALVRLEDEQDSKLRRIGQLEQELDSSNKELEELERKLMESNDKNQRLAVQQESAQGEISFLREEQESDKIRIGDLEAALANVEQMLRDEKDRTRELDNRLHQEREQREIVANQEKEEIQQFVNSLNKETSQARDEAKRLRKNLSSREVEATEWKERLIELENNLREALGDLNGTRSSLLKSIASMQRELENTVRELDLTKAAVNEKDRIIKKRDELLESHALERSRVGELLEKERMGHRNVKSEYESFKRTHDHLSSKASTQDLRIAELETTRGQERRRLIMLEQQARDQLLERNELLLVLWQKLSALCGKEWLNGNALVDGRVVPTVEVIAARLPGFSKNLLAAIRAIDLMVGSFQTKIKAVERDLSREYQSLENMLDVRTKKLDRLEAMVRNTAAAGSMSSHELHSRMLRLEDKCRQLKVENATLKTSHDVRSRVAYSSIGNNPEALLMPGEPGSPSPSVPRGPGDRSRSSHGGSRAGTLTRNHTAPSGHEIALSRPETQAGGDNDHRWMFRLRDMESKLKLEREGRNQDRSAARLRLGGLESENKELRDQVRRGREV